MDQTSYNNLQLLNRSIGDEGGILTMGIVSDKIDTRNTWLNPEGNDTPAQTIIIDFNHQNEPTGAKMLRTYIGYVKINSDGTFDIQNVPTVGHIMTLIGDILVPKNSRMLIKGMGGVAKDVGSLYEAVKAGRVAWGSVQFDPAPYPEETRTDKNGRIYYGKYRITYFTLLDKAPSQDMSFKFNQQNFRMIENNQTPETVTETVETTIISPEIAETVTETEIVETQRAAKNKSFEKHDLAKHTDKEGKPVMVRISQLQENLDKENSYTCDCRDLDDKEYSVMGDGLSEPSEDETRAYIQKVHAKMDESNIRKEDSEIEKPEDEAAENDEEEKLEIKDDTKRVISEEEDAKADTELFEKLVKPLAEQITALATKLDSYINKDTEEDKDTKRFAHNPALIPVENLSADESRGAETPASLSKDQDVATKIKQFKLMKQFYK